MWCAVWPAAGSTPVTVLVCSMGLRVDNKNTLQERLHFLRDMMGVEHAMFFTFEGACVARMQGSGAGLFGSAVLFLMPLSFSKQHRLPAH